MAEVNSWFSGVELVAAIERAARERNVALVKFAAPLSSDPRKWLQQARAVTQPKPGTIARVNALIEGRPVPPPAYHNFQTRTRRRTTLHASDRHPVPPTAPVDRDPCFHCGVRGDIGCGCRAVFYG